MILSATEIVLAQEPPPAPPEPQAPMTMAMPMGDAGGWSWGTGVSAFFGFNDQERKFRDFRAWESQNWLMGMASHHAPGGRLTLNAMSSLEPFTMKDIGSAQVFQTGETYAGAPLIDYQHPHDLFMELGGDYRASAHGVTITAGGGVVGPATLGPPPFMHRPSAYGNPTAPLAHHNLDSTHISRDVIRVGVGRGAFMLEASTFHGREPDEERTDLDFGVPDSYAARLSWARGAWSAQVSAAALTMPEATTPYNAKKITGSIGVTDAARRVTAWMFAFGQNREIHGNLEAYLFEATVRAGRGGHIYTRAESVAKDILDAGFHPRGVFHRHRQSQVGAFTGGYERTVIAGRAGNISVGGDLTGYFVPDNLDDPYGQPWSTHVFIHYTLH